MAKGKEDGCALDADLEMQCTVQHPPGMHTRVRSSKPAPSNQVRMYLHLKGSRFCTQERTDPGPNGGHRVIGGQ